MDNMSQRYVDDHSLSQDAHKIGHIAKKSVEDAVKLLIEGIYYWYQQQQKQAKISFTSPDDLIQNTKDALTVGADDRTLGAFMDMHQSTQMIAQRYPQNVEGFKQDVISEAKQDLLVESQKRTPEFNQAFEQMQKQKQSQTQSQGQSLSM